ncbi:MAG: hypothetical protein WAK03_00530 [Methylocystis sp.]|jgi:hypothetical protein
MNFVELVLTVCTLAQPQACEEKKLLFSSETGSLHGCMMQAQPYIAQWSGDHPTVHVERWRCVAPGSEGDKI